MIKVRQYTGHFRDLLNWGLDLEFWEETQEIISGYLCVPEELARMQIYFAYDQSRIIGFIFGEDTRCIRIAVDYRYRNQGIGKELIEVSGFSDPYDVEDSEEARGFWISTGYKVPQSKVLVTV